MMKNLWLWLLGLLAMGVLAYFCFGTKSEVIKEKLLHNAQSLYAKSGMDWVQTDLAGDGLEMKRVLTLEGTAPSAEMREKAATMAMMVPGIARVENHLKVAIQEEAPKIDIPQELEPKPVVKEALVKQPQKDNQTVASIVPSIPDLNESHALSDEAMLADKAVEKSDFLENRENNLSNEVEQTVDKAEKKSEKIVPKDINTSTAKQTVLSMQNKAKKPSPTLKGVSIKCQYLIKNVMMQNKIHFHYNKATIKADSFPLLDRIVTIAKECADTKIVIGGYTDSQGSEKYNLWLSQQRADAVKSYMIESGVDKKHLKAIGYGEQKPIADNSKEAGRAKNRRIEFSVQGVQK